jgi:drug/metabolite transporter (DMT)-like permease
VSFLSKYLPNVALVLASLIWASSFIALKYAFLTFDPMIVIFGRLFVASIAFLFLWKYISNVKIEKQDVKYLFLMALFEPCIYFIFESQAVKNTTAANAGIITALLPLMVAFAARTFLKEKLTINMLIGFVLAISGSIWLSLTTNSSAYSPNPLYGNFMEFLAMVCATGYTIILKHLSSKFNPFFLTATQAFVGAFFYLPIILLPSVQKPISFEFLPIAAIVYLGVIVTIGAYGLYNYGVARTKASTASAYVNLIPAFTIILAFILLGEKLSLSGLIASSVIFIGVFISQTKGFEKRKALA